MTNEFAKQSEKEIDNLLLGMNEKAGELLREFFVGKTLKGEPWAEEHFEVTMKVIVDTTIANSDVTDFNINTSIEDHMLLMNVQDDKKNTVADVMYFVTQNGTEDYFIDDLMVVFKIGPFLALQDDASDELPF